MIHLPVYFHSSPALLSSSYILYGRREWIVCCCSYKVTTAWHSPTRFVDNRFYALHTINKFKWWSQEDGTYSSPLLFLSQYETKTWMTADGPCNVQTNADTVRAPLLLKPILLNKFSIIRMIWRALLWHSLPRMQYVRILIVIRKIVNSG